MLSPAACFMIYLIGFAALIYTFKFATSMARLPDDEDGDRMEALIWATLIVWPVVAILIALTALVVWVRAALNGKILRLNE